MNFDNPPNWLIYNQTDWKTATVKKFYDKNNLTQEYFFGGESFLRFAGNDTPMMTPVTTWINNQDNAGHYMIMNMKEDNSDMPNYVDMFFLARNLTIDEEEVLN